MPNPKPPSDELLDELAELRAGGATWESTAQKMKRSLQTIRQWPRRYRERWLIAFHRAEYRLFLDYCAESAVTLRKHLRSTNEESQRQAARIILRHRRHLDSLEKPAEAPIIIVTQNAFDLHSARNILGGMSDEEQAAFLDRIGAGKREAPRILTD